MKENKDNVELKEEELEEVSGGFRQATGASVAKGVDLVMNSVNMGVDMNVDSNVNSIIGESVDATVNSRGIKSATKRVISRKFFNKKNQQ